MLDMAKATITREQVERFLLEECIGPEESALMLNMSVSHFRTLVATCADAPKPVRHLGIKSVKYLKREIEAFAERRDAEAKAVAEKKASRAKLSA